MNKNKMRTILTNTLNLLIEADKAAGDHKTDILLPLLTLMAQELELRKMRMVGKDPHDEDVERVGQEVHVLQMNPMSYPIVYLALQFGYLIATHHDELYKQATDLDETMRTQRESTTLQ